MIIWEGCGSQIFSLHLQFVYKIQTMIRMMMTLKRTMRLLMMMINYGDDYDQEVVVMMKMI